MKGNAPDCAIGAFIGLQLAFMIKNVFKITRIWPGSYLAVPSRGNAVGPVKISTEYLAQIETAISIIYGKYVYTYGYLR
jgi:uncharacterized membrane protein (Fun14 family)